MVAPIHQSRARHLLTYQVPLDPDGKEHGISRTYYDGSESVFKVARWVHGKLRGTIRLYHQNGRMWNQRRLDGVRTVGRGRQWNEEGVLEVEFTETTQKWLYADGRRKAWINKDTGERRAWGEDGHEVPFDLISLPELRLF